MSTDCENLLRKFLVLNPAKRASLEVIMRDKWMNMGHEEEELKPYIEPIADLKDPKRIGKTGTVYEIKSHSCWCNVYLFLNGMSFDVSIVEEEKKKEVLNFVILCNAIKLRWPSRL